MKTNKNVSAYRENSNLSKAETVIQVGGPAIGATSVKVVEVRPYLRHMRSRMPFRFGNTVMTGMPVVHLRVRLQDARGRSFEGWSACGVVSMWFDKDYSKSEKKRESDLLYSVAEAVNGYCAAGIGSAWQLHQDVEPAVRLRLGAAGLNGLTAGYGIALMDAAVTDGVCRHAGLPFFEGLKQGLLGLNSSIGNALPSHPSSTIALRHTIGLGDPLVAGDVTEPLADGLPQTLEQVITQYGARYFKIKVNNDLTMSLDRLRQIAAVLERYGVDYRATLDGNEAFPGMEDFSRFVSACAANETIRPLWNRVLWIEQPVARQNALQPDVAQPLSQVSMQKSVIIDESDDDDSALERALALGYKGISAKNCKGIFRTLSSHLSIRNTPAEAGLILSSEDLTNQPILPNHQDLCVAAALGITHSERNGHHFFRGFDFLSPTEQEQALQEYPSLYQLATGEVPSLRFMNGEMSMTEINDSPGLGVQSAPDWDTLDAVVLPQEPQQLNS